MRQAKPKKVSYELIEPTSEVGGPIYERMLRLIEQHHDELTDARIALAWNTAWKPDVDGRCKLGMCKKASDLDRELAAFDFVIILRREFWFHAQVNDNQRNALLDHELMHATVKLDSTGDPVHDERGRVIYRIRKHDIEEFGAIVARYGLYKRDLQWFVEQVPKAGELEVTVVSAEADEAQVPPVETAGARAWWH